MISKSEISIALAAAEQPIMIESAAQLREALAEWLSCEVIGIDTEFVRERTWRADLGLVQLSDGKRVWLVDPLKTGPLDSLAALFETESVIKVLHAPSEDLDILFYVSGAVPEPLFDTQVACSMLGQSLQMGYHSTVEWLLELTIDKGETRSNWIKRPLRPAQLKYAALDVCLLPMMYRQLRSQLLELGRLEWLQEDCTRLLNKARTASDPTQSWKRINGNGRLDETSLAILQALCTWREAVAEKSNLARGFVIKDTALLTLANQKPGTLEALSKLDIWHPKSIQRHGQTVLNIIQQCLDRGLKSRSPADLEPEHRKLMSNMRRLVLERSTKLKLEPALLASRRELEGLILSPGGEPVPERFLGWRKDIISDDLIALKDKYT
jgi:ribonuclease D